MEENKFNSLEDNLDMASYIMLHRIYDLLTLISSKMAPEETAKMVQYHEDGYLLGPTPSYRPAEEENI